jgi:hypothetical protein
MILTAHPLLCSAQILCEWSTMRRLIVASILSTVPPLLPAVEQPAPAPPALTDAMIRQAVKEALAAAPAPDIPLRARADAYSAGSPIEQRMTRAFNEAKIPDCLHSGAMKFTPPQLGPVVLTEEFAVPFWAYAALTGKCR